ncbi:hypothetical protein [Microvirga sp. G4-2]|uniref:hypothetical protein n=1 Tax=Microvirga sp. G4-2 TaxID=3434467 RepID=UPI0040450AF8
MDMLRRIFSRSASSVDPVVDDLPGSSLHAIKQKRIATGCELMAHIYRYAESRFIVTSIMWVPGSVIVETGEPSILPIDVSDADLGRTVCKHLLQHEAREPPNLRDHKLTDWAAYRASGATSASSFENRSWRVTVETTNLVLNVEAAPVRSLDAGISAKGVVSPLHEELGATIRRALSAAEAIRLAGLV